MKQRSFIINQGGGAKKAVLPNQTLEICKTRATVDQPQGVIEKAGNLGLMMS